jgi:hypothetical protein
VKGLRLARSQADNHNVQEKCAEEMSLAAEITLGSATVILQVYESSVSTRLEVLAELVACQLKKLAASTVPS